MKRAKRHLIACALGLCLLGAALPAAANLLPAPAASEWQAFTRRYMAADGRIIDTANRGISHSEGQGYAMVFAAHFNDRARFDLLWRWRLSVEFLLGKLRRSFERFRNPERHQQKSTRPFVHLPCSCQPDAR